jgi:hypothetical protein
MSSACAPLRSCSATSVPAGETSATRRSPIQPCPVLQRQHCGGPARQPLQVGADARRVLLVSLVAGAHLAEVADAAGLAAEVVHIGVVAQHVAGFVAEGAEPRRAGAGTPGHSCPLRSRAPLALERIDVLCVDLPCGSEARSARARARRSSGGIFPGSSTVSRQTMASPFKLRDALQRTPSAAGTRRPGCLSGSASSACGPPRVTIWFRMEACDGGLGQNALWLTSTTPGCNNPAYSDSLGSK